ncbi:topoisomerase [Pseudomonas parafulva]|uniref:topoisomerase n=1 Tax=Pseudomonas parafulva TaxID=157782 RepID=UPI003563F9C9
MAKRDPNVTARNKSIAAMKNELRDLQSKVFPEIGIHSEQSLNAYIGSKADKFIDLKNEIISTPEQYIHCWLSGMEAASKTYEQEIKKHLKNPKNINFKKYVFLFLKRSFLKHYNELHKKRPSLKDAEIWFGVNDAHYGLFVTPRWNGVSWENDKSEIRAAKFTYWTIGHVMQSGLCIPDENDKYSFTKIEDYLDFFKAQVRLTKSTYQIEIAKRYIEYVLASDKPHDIPLLIPEIRYDGSGRKHVYRLDFMVINPFTMEKIGFEISPWSTHGKLSGKHKTLIELNEEAKSNFEKEMKKIRAYFKKYTVPIFHFSDSDLVDLDGVWDEIKDYLDPGVPPKQLEMSMFSEYFGGC